MKKNIFLLVASFLSAALWAQYSIGTDVSLLRSFSKDQRFFALGQTVQVNFHVSKRGTGYAGIAYYTSGRFKNNLRATAKDININPVTVDYTSGSVLRYRQVSLGWKHFFKGSYDEELTWNLYGLAGFGLLLGTVTNTFNKPVNATNYNVPPRAVAGSAFFKRLTFDVGIGAETALGTGIYVYSDIKTWLPASDYPSPYLYNNDVPRIILVNGGIRILID